MARNTADHVLSKEDIQTLMNVLTPVASKCSALGLQLGVKYCQIKNIEKNYRHDCESQLRAILEERLNQAKPLTCRDLVAALSSDSVRETRVAHQIESHYSTPQSLLSTPQQEGPNVSVAQSEASLPPSSSQFPSQQNSPLPRPSTNPSYQPTHYGPPSQVATSGHPQYINQGLQYNTTLYQQHSISNHYAAHPHITTQEASIIHGGSRPPVTIPDNPTLPSASPQASGVASQTRTYPGYHQPPPPGTYIIHQQQQPSPHVFQQSVPQHMYQSPPYNPYPYHQIPPQNLSQQYPHPPANLFYNPYYPPPYIQHSPPPQVATSVASGHVPETRSPPAERPREQSPVRHSPQSQHLSSQHQSTSQRTAPLPEPVEQYIKYVRTVYRKSVVEKDSQSLKWPPTPSKVYLNLVHIDRTKVGKRSEVTEARVRYGDVDVHEEWPIDFNEIAAGVSDNGEERLVLVEGAPGVGKSTFAWEYCRRWERGEIAKQYQLVLLLRLRDERMSKAHTLKDLIYHPSEDVRQAVTADLEQSHGSNTLILLEGFDELPDTCRSQQSIFVQLVCGDLLPQATVMVTSRPWATEKFVWRYSHRIFQHLELLGFTTQQISEYIKSALPESEAKDLELYVKNHPQIRGCMYIPLNSAIVVTVYQDRQASGCPLPTTLTELYTALTQILLIRYLKGHPELGKGTQCIGIFKGLNVPNRVQRNFTELCKLAYKGIAADQDEIQLIFKESELPDDFDNLGFMDSVTELHLTRETVSSHNFLHLTFQEFFAAVHISTISQAEQLKHFQRHEDGRLKVVLRFLAGITKMNCFSTSENVDEFLMAPQGEGGEYSLKCDTAASIDLVNWMFEAQSDNIIGLLGFDALDTEPFIVGFCFDYSMSPMDYYSLGYCIAHSQCQWVLELTMCYETGFYEEMLAAGSRLRPDNPGRVVGITSVDKEENEDEYYVGDMKYVSSIFVGLKHILHLHELTLGLRVPCSEVLWPDLSSLRILKLVITKETPNKLALDTLLTSLTHLESLTLAGDNFKGPPSSEYHEPIGSYIRKATTLKELLLGYMGLNEEGIDVIASALASNPLSLERLELTVGYSFTDTAAGCLGQFIRNSTTLQSLRLWGCEFRVGGLQVLAQALHHSTLEEKEVEYLDVILDDEREKEDLERLLREYPDMRKNIRYINGETI